MATPTYTLLNSYQATGSVASIAFTSIPQTYTDLLLVGSLRETQAGVIGGPKVRPNNVTTNFTGKRLYGAGTSYGSDNLTAWFLLDCCSNATTNTFGNSEIYIPNYTSSINKSASVNSTMENNSTTDWEVEIHGSLWSNTSAITSLYVYPDSGNFVQYSSLYLYGIKNS